MKRRCLLGLIGANIGGSLSPALHEDAFAAAGITGYYHLMDAAEPPRRLEELLAAARTAGFAGVNVTYPFKEAVIALLDEVSPEAAEIGAVNTVVIDAAGRTAGHNTDRSGFRRAFLESIGESSVYDKPVLLLGAGGAGRAVAFALIDMGAGLIEIYDRDEAKAGSLFANLTARFGTRRCRLVRDLGAAIAKVAGIVNSTPVGMVGHRGVPMATDPIKSSQFVADIIYTPLDTAFVIAARRKGCQTMNGGGMCVHQAADAFYHFTGHVPDRLRMVRTFATACARRGVLLSVD